MHDIFTEASSYVWSSGIKTILLYSDTLKLWVLHEHVSPSKNMSHNLGQIYKYK